MKQSTKAMMKKHGWRFDRFIHNYLYFKFYYPYVRFIYHFFSFLSSYLSWFKPLNAVISMAVHRYHAKVLSFKDAEKILTLNEDVRAVSDRNKRIVPFKYAHRIIFENPAEIAVMDCPCKKTLGDKDENINSCIAVGGTLVSFWLEHCGDKYHARRISQNEAIGIITRFRSMGYLTQAFFKVATGGQTGVICNCHPDTCVSLRASRMMKRFDPRLSQSVPSGYSIRRNESACTYCGTCVRVCPVSCIDLDPERRTRSYDANECLGCEICVEHCPSGALESFIDSGKPAPLDIDAVKKEEERFS